MFDWLDAGAHLGQHPGGGAAPSLVFERWLLAGLRPSARLGLSGGRQTHCTADCRAAGAALKWPAQQASVQPSGGVGKRRRGFSRVESIPSVLHER